MEIEISQLTCTFQENAVLSLEEQLQSQRDVRQKANAVSARASERMVRTYASNHPCPLYQIGNEFSSYSFIYVETKYLALSVVTHLLKSILQTVRVVFAGEEVLIKLKARDTRLKRGGRSISKACRRGVIVKANHRTHHYTVEYSSKTGNKERISLKADDICLHDQTG